MVEIENFALEVYILESIVTDVICVAGPNEAATIPDFRGRSIGRLEDRDIKPTPTSCLGERDVALIVRVGEELYLLNFSNHCFVQCLSEIR